jgi:hypothetical protein
MEVAEDFQGALTGGLLVGGMRDGSRCGRDPRWRRARRAEMEPGEREIFLETLKLEEIREFKGADVAAAGTDLTLEVKDQTTEILGAVALREDQSPLALTFEMQRQELAGEFAVEGMETHDGFGVPLWPGRIQGEGFSVPGSCDPRKGVEGGLDVGPGDLTTLCGGGQLKRTLEQPVEESGRTLGALQEEFFGRGFEG